LRTLYTYGHSIDYGREEDFIDCWTTDAALYVTSETVHGHAELLQYFRARTHAPTVDGKHLVLSPVIDIDGDQATAQSMFARLDTRSEGPAIGAFGRYLDVLRRCADGRWRLSERRAQVEARPSR
jgi:ketosteroid isomerase-like protein